MINLEGGLLARDSEKQMEDSGNGVSLTLWELCEGTWRGASLLQTLRDM
jgi:hypothetical protein